MAIGGWVLATLGAAALGWMGRPVLVLLPESPDAVAHVPTYRSISRAPNLCWWLAGSAAALVALVALSVPMYLLPAWVVLCGVGTWLAYVDWRTTLLPTRIIWPLYAVTVGAIALESWVATDPWVLGRAVLASGVAVGCFWVLWWVAGRRRPGSFGFGDVRFSAPLALGLGSVGVQAAAIGIYLGFVVGALVGLGLRARGRGDHFAFGPAMLAGAVLGVIVT